MILGKIYHFETSIQSISTGFSFAGNQNNDLNGIVFRRGQISCNWVSEGKAVGLSVRRVTPSCRNSSLMDLAWPNSPTLWNAVFQFLPRQNNLFRLLNTLNHSLVRKVPSLSCLSIKSWCKTDLYACKQETSNGCNMKVNLAGTYISHKFSLFAAEITDASMWHGATSSKIMIWWSFVHEMSDFAMFSNITTIFWAVFHPDMSRINLNPGGTLSGISFSLKVRLFNNTNCGSKAWICGRWLIAATCVAVPRFKLRLIKRAGGRPIFVFFGHVALRS